MWITLGITRPLRQGMAVSQALVKSDLTATITVASHDETGQLLDAMQEMVAKFSQIMRVLSADEMAALANVGGETGESVAEAR